MIKIVSVDFTKHTHTKGKQPQKIIEKIHKTETGRTLVMPIKKKEKRYKKRKVTVDTREILKTIITLFGFWFEQATY